MRCCHRTSSQTARCAGRCLGGNAAEGPGEESNKAESQKNKPKKPDVFSRFSLFPWLFCQFSVALFSRLCFLGVNWTCFHWSSCCFRLAFSNIILLFFVPSRFGGFPVSPAQPQELGSTAADGATTATKVRKRAGFGPNFFSIFLGTMFLFFLYMVSFSQGWNAQKMSGPLGVRWPFSVLSSWAPGKGWQHSCGAVAPASRGLRSRLRQGQLALRTLVCGGYFCISAKLCFVSAKVFGVTPQCDAQPFVTALVMI